ncbi:tigger transposable element-derived protein 6-like [Stylophora pistillata]|uniref:Tigger transposable element-derived protein 6 n=1 Tax=Stylophora pistillata TaxID=50429 RepID=A0A2B4SN08_STYPI|nr:tigger transposable element-derived protein 6-like [Stylophora pistillata]PFX29968.1 Tigger transposable element-derived protein 6 [Stylophora pistillata]
MPLCWICELETNYNCLSCQASVCNRAECSVAAPEETLNWKAGSRVAFCSTCSFKTADEKDGEEINQTEASLTRKEDAKPSTSQMKSQDGIKKKVQEKRKCLSLQQRVEVIVYAKDHPKEGYRKIAEKFGIGRTQAHKILKQRNEILALYERNSQSNQRKRGRSARYSKVNEVVWQWYVICSNLNIPVSGTMLQEEALLVAEKLGISGFAASNGWLESFKKHYNICSITKAGQNEDLYQATIESWNGQVRKFIRGWKPEDVWNMDETGSFWRGLPETSLNNKRKQCNIGGKQANQRTTWVFFVNAAGEKEDPIVIGRYLKPRCFKNLKDTKRLYQCYYFANSKAWMTKEIMTDVLSQLNETLIQKKRSILLFLDNAPCHSLDLAGKFSNIGINFLPNNTTSKTQPLEAGIITNWKVKFKNRLLRYVCSKVSQGKSASEVIKSVDISMAIQWGRQAWDEVSPETIIRCFKKTRLYPEEIMEEDNTPEGEDELGQLQELINKIGSGDAEAYISAENQLEVCLGNIESSDPNWRKSLRDQLLNEGEKGWDVTNGLADERAPRIEERSFRGDDEYDPESKQPAIRTISEAEKVAEQLTDFAHFNGHQDLSLALSQVSDLIHEIKLQKAKGQPLISNNLSC